MQKSTRVWCCLSVLGLAGLPAGCKDQPQSPLVPATVIVGVATVGEDRDGDGYELFVDAARLRTVAARDTVELLGLTEGEHTLELRGTAPNCAILNNPRVVSVTKGVRTSVGFTSECRLRSFALEVRVVTTGPDPDLNGYTVLLNDSSARILGRNSSATFADLPPGAVVSVALTGVAANCKVSPSEQTATILRAGTALVEFAVACEPNVGGVRVTTHTVGGDVDPDGYFAFAPAVAREPLANNSSATIAGVHAGSQAIRLGAVAQNCIVSGGNSRSVTVVFADVVDVTFEITCMPTSGPYYTIVYERAIGDGSTRFPFSGNEVCTVRSDGLQQQCVPHPFSYAPSWSPSGDRILYWHYGDLYTATYPGHSTQQLTFTFDVNESDPVWSPDGATIACVVGGMVQVMKADGSGAKTIGQGTTPRFSPDGSRIVVERYITFPNIYTMASDGSDVRQLTTTWYNWNPSFTPDGTRVMFGSNRQGIDGIYTVNLDGSGITRLDALGSVREAYYTPDGQKIVLVKSIDGGQDIFLINPDGTDEKRVTSNTAATRPSARP